MIRLRPPTREDGPRAAEIVIAVDVAEVGEPDYSLEDLHDEWGEPGFDLAEDAVVAEADGEIIGYAHFRGGDLLACVHPERQGEGAGSALLDWAERRARERGEDRLRQGIGDRAHAARALLEARGYSVVRSYYRMERPLGDEGEPGFRAVRADDELFAIWEAAFSRNADYEPRSEEAWTQRHLHAHNVDFETSRIEPGRGFTLVRRWEEAVAYVEELAVHPDHAGRGLGGALLTATFAAARANGYRHVTLSVASDNPNALRLYERVGMTQRWRIDDYHKPLPD
ncbi:GNAT family N-acetyltransferase [Solirubrobacter sp. CPCC 204708]|uniref:GNAT family N-acetyltransferase n=1 Tax=Solirubrobacter deserti TaxID=2282478 RepID=A0ABT4RMY7_9ACTN|nr:GNAT family N-acetyltransferase [Solirubrobacter deserti]MBE2314976.1 GNAT family N-acetyltransferase [Solirubrobacter deserti]MDA0139891.1 GNAT family N-acetyltransferase [Solirubrobacter deserti]